MKVSDRFKYVYQSKKLFLKGFKTIIIKKNYLKYINFFLIYYKKYHIII